MISFVQKVFLKANNLGIAGSQVYVTGHSLGGEEAEYVSSRFALGGVAFGGPGLPNYTDGGQHNNFTTYVDYGDPVGNYASHMPVTTGKLKVVPAMNMDHVGKVDMVGNKSDATLLNEAAAKSDIALFETYPLFAEAFIHPYHDLKNYASDLNISSLRPLGGASASAAASAPEDFLYLLDSSLGAAGRDDLRSANAENANNVETNDFSVNRNIKDDQITVNQYSDLFFAALGIYGDAGTDVIDYSASGDGIIYESFTDDDNGAIHQFVPDNISESMNHDASFLQNSDDTFTIGEARRYDGTVSNFVLGDTIDLVGIGGSSVSLNESDVLSLQATSGKPVNIQLDEGQNYNGDLFEMTSDGNGGTYINIATVSAATSTPTISESAGSEQFTLTRMGDTSQAITVYVSTTDGSTVAGESVNSGALDPFVYQPVTFAAGSSTADVFVGISNLQLYDGVTKNYGIQVTKDQSGDNVLTSSQFYIQDELGTTAIFQYIGKPFSALTGGSFAGDAVKVDVTVDDYTPDFAGQIYGQQGQLGPYVASSTISIGGMSQDATNRTSFYVSNGAVDEWEVLGNGGSTSQYIFSFNDGGITSDQPFDSVGKTYVDFFGGYGHTAGAGTWTLISDQIGNQAIAGAQTSAIASGLTSLAYHR